MKPVMICNKRTNKILKLILFLSLSSLMDAVVIENSNKSPSKLSNFVQDLTEKSRHRRSPSELEINNGAIVHPGINPVPSNNLMRMVLRSHRANTESELSSSPSVPCGNCQTKKMFITIKKRSCKSMRIKVPACQGLCESWAVPHYESPYVRRYHPVCRPARTEFRKYHLPGCRGNNVVYIVVPTECECGVCDGRSTACGNL